MEEIVSISFRREERSYFSTPSGWRLATFEEVSNALDIIKEQNILKRWDRVRLLDCWILGPGYNFEMGNDFKGCLGYMLLKQTQASGDAYAGVNLSDSGKEVALFLCVDDWNYEVVYWLLNCWSNSETMNLGDVRGGNLPFSNATEFKKMNATLSSVARKLGEEGGAAREKAAEKAYTGRDSVKDVLSGMIKIVTEEKDIMESIADSLWQFRWFTGDEYCLPEYGVQVTGDVAEAFWSFVCETFAGYVVEVCSLESLLYISYSMKTNSTSEKNLMMASYILLYLSDFRSDIIHEPLPHRCLGSCAKKILSYAAKEANGNPQSFKEMLKHNGMWRYYNDTESYDVLSKLVLIVSDGKYADIQRVKITGTVVDMLMKCGAQPYRSYAIGKYRNKTALHNAAKFPDEEVSREIGKALLDRCEEGSRDHFLNAADERGRVALHRASEEGNASLCQLLVELGASLKVQDQNGMSPLHYALEGQIEKVIAVFVESPYVHGKSELLDLKDTRGRSPLNIAIAKKDFKSTEKLLSKSEKPEAYFNEPDMEHLLRHVLLAGSVDLVQKLFEYGIKLPAGDCDEDGNTALHLALMCDDEFSARDIIDLTTEGKTSANVAEMVAAKNGRGMTALHVGALKGHTELCQTLLRMNPELIYIKDRDGRNPLHHAVQGKNKGTAIYKNLLEAYSKKEVPEDDLMDRSGLTPLHVAVLQGKSKMVEKILSDHKIKTLYLNRGDFMGQTALHKAAKRGDNDIVKILLKKGAHPLSERDCDGRTALHYAVQAEKEEKQKVAEMLLRKCASDEEKSLLLWAPAAGMGTADKNLKEDDPLRKFLLDQKSAIQKKIADRENNGVGKRNLLQMAACIGDLEMTKTLISRGYQLRDIQDAEWVNSLLDPTIKENVEKVSKQIENIKEQGNDKPAISDSLGRLDYAQGLAALFLNPYISPPITVGISGSWGMGKSSLMVQTERILLTTAAQMALLESSKLSPSALTFPGINRYELSKRGKRTCQHIFRHIKNGEKINRNIFVTLRDNICSMVRGSDKKFNRKIFVALRENICSMVRGSDKNEIQKELENFLDKYELKYRKVFKSLAAMDSHDMFQTCATGSKEDTSGEEKLPAVLTVQYNAWKYRDDTEALAGIAVEITKELEGMMTQAQWLNTCWRNTWKKKKCTLWIEIFFPSLLALVLVGSFTWIAWVVFDSDKLKEWGKAKYAWPPAAIVITVWTLTKSVMGMLKPVSTQLMQYISFPDHTDKLGYQERVISDIMFLKDEVGRKPYWVFIILAWVFTAVTVLWRLITDSSITSLLFHQRRVEKAMEAPKVDTASGVNLRIIVFVDDLDRCEESVILQVRSAVNLVLAVCEISVVLGMDKRLIERAILKNYGEQTNQELADMYLQKIVQLPLDLPEPSYEQSKRFLTGQLGVLPKNENKDFVGDDGSSSSDVESSSGDSESSSGGDGESSSSDEAEQLNTIEEVAINVQSTSATVAMERSNPGATGEVPSQTDDDATNASNKNLSSSTLIRELLFVRYSQGEENAFLYFQSLATDFRKLPREWKRLLNYHRLVWFILSVSNEAKNLDGWQVQLVNWIFICWEWQENMNLIIQNWRKIGDLKKLEDPSMLVIVEHLIDKHERQNKMMDVDKLKENSEGKGIAESKGDIQDMDEAISQGLAKDMKNKLDALEKSLAELKKEMKEIKDLVSDELKKDLKELKKQVSDELKKDINEIKLQVIKTQNGMNGENIECKKIEFHNLDNWKRMKSALERYDVTMDGIHVFQRFRFYCIDGYLPQHTTRRRRRKQS